MMIGVLFGILVWPGSLHASLRADYPYLLRLFQSEIYDELVEHEEVNHNPAQGHRIYDSRLELLHFIASRTLKRAQRQAFERPHAPKRIELAVYFYETLLEDFDQTEVFMGLYERLSPNALPVYGDREKDKALTKKSLSVALALFAVKELSHSSLEEWADSDVLLWLRKNQGLILERDSASASIQNWFLFEPAQRLTKAGELYWVVQENLKEGSSQDRLRKILRETLAWQETNRAFKNNDEARELFITRLLSTKATNSKDFANEVSKLKLSDSSFVSVNASFARSSYSLALRLLSELLQPVSNLEEQDRLLKELKLSAAPLSCREILRMKGETE